jgi:hypothetical protein
MAKRIILLSIPLLAALVVLVAWAVVEKGRPPDWRTALDQYISYKRQGSHETLEVESYVHSSHPWDFTQEMSKSTFGDSIIFEVSASDSYSESLGGDLKPLPYPPDDLWCVLLKLRNNTTAATGTENEYRLVFVALYNDLYNAEWIVHENADDSLNGDQYRDQSPCR